MVYTCTEGRVFINEDPELVEIIVNFLREKEEEDSQRPILFAEKIPEGKKEKFDSLLNYYGLTSLFFGEVFTSYPGGNAH